MKNDEHYLSEALVLAQKSFDLGEVPVGALIIDEEGEVIGRGYNLVESTKTQLAHAEVQALADAAKRRGDWRLEGCTLYVTLEPCVMCLGALLLSRVSEIVYGAASPEYGAVRLFSEMSEPYRAHAIIRQALQPQECGDMLKRFFTQIRATLKDKTCA